MPCLDVQIPAADGHSNGTLHLPESAGPWPGVLVFPDAGGVQRANRPFPAMALNFEQIVCLKSSGPAVAIEQWS